MSVRNTSERKRGKQERLERSRKQRINSLGKWGAIGLISAGALFSGILYLNNGEPVHPTQQITVGNQYSDADRRREISDRHALYAKHLAGTEYEPRPILDIMVAPGYLEHVKSSEEDFQRNSGLFYDFVEKEGKLTELSSSNFERFGYVKFKDGKFELIDKSAVKGAAIQYVREILQGDYRHLIALQNIVNYNFADVVLQNDEERIAIIAAISALIKKDEFDRLAPEQRKTFSIYFYIGKGVVRQPFPDFEKFYRDSRTLLTEWVKPASGPLMSSVPGMLTPDAIADPAIISRWHTHPLNDLNYMPSPPDEANTYMNGPNVLFSRTGGVLRVYTIIKGKTEEIYRAKIN